MIDIIQAMKKGGYKPNEEGMCYGITAVAAQSVMRGKGEDFISRVKKIQRDDPIPEGAEKTNATIDSTLEPPEAYGLFAPEIYAFFDEISMYQGLSLDFAIDQQDYRRLSAVFSKHDSKVPSFSDIYLSTNPHRKVTVKFSKKSMTEFLQSVHKQSKTPFSLFISYEGHATQIGFDGKQWLAVNHDCCHYGQELNENLVRTVLDDDKNDCYLAAIDIIGRDKDADLALNILDIDNNSSVPEKKLLQLSLIGGDAKSATKFIERILGSNLEPKDKVELLSAKKEDGTPGFVFGLIGSNSEAVKAYVKAILDSNLAPKDKVELLSAKKEDGTPGFVFGLIGSNPETVEAYVKAILDSSNLDLKDKVELLSVKRNDRLSGLGAALIIGHPKTIKAYVDAVLGSNLDPKDKVKLLSAKSEDGTPALRSALNGANSETVKAYVDAVLGSNLAPKDKVELLSAKDENGTPALHLAAMLGDSKVIEAYVDAVLGSNLKLKDKVKLLSAKSKDGTPALYNALKYGNPETVEAYVKAILDSSNLDLKDKVELLSAKSLYGTPALYSALKYGNSETVKACAGAVFGSNLELNAKVELLLVKYADKPNWNSLPAGYSEKVEGFINDAFSSDLKEKDEVEQQRLFLSYLLHCKEKTQRATLMSWVFGCCGIRA